MIRITQRIIAICKNSILLSDVLRKASEQEVDQCKDENCNSNNQELF